MTPSQEQTASRPRRLAATLWGGRVRFAYGAGVAVFVWIIAQFFDGTTGFSSLLSIGAKLDASTVTQLKKVPHYVYDEGYGYDGAYYVQIALHPWLDEPELKQSIDNLPYRAKRILLCWVAWIAGLGQRYWVVQSFAVLNLFAWFGLAWLLLRWFPPTCWSNLLRWGGVLFSQGVCMSVRNSLVDAPGLLLVAAAVACLERGRQACGVGALAAAALTKETSLIATTALAQPPIHGWRQWARLAGVGLLAALPWIAWAAYVRWRLGPASDSGFGNFTLPFAGAAEKWGTTVAELLAHGWGQAYVANLVTMTALSVQFAFLVTRWRPRPIWWRVGASYAVLMALVAQPVWEGYPGAASRVLLPMTLAFNVLVPHRRRWLPVLLAGNLSVLVGAAELNSPPVEIFRVSGDRAVRSVVKVEVGSGWYGPEAKGERHWRWSSGPGKVRLVNNSNEPLQVRLAGEASAIQPRRLALKVDGREVWSAGVATRPHRFAPTTLALPPGGTCQVEFVADQPGVRVPGGDPRVLSFAIYDVAISVARPGGKGQPQPR